MSQIVRKKPCDICDGDKYPDQFEPGTMICKTCMVGILMRKHPGKPSMWAGDYLGNRREKKRENSRDRRMARRREERRLAGIRGKLS